MGHPVEAEAVYRDREGNMVVRRQTPQLLATCVTGVASEPMVHWYIREFHGFVSAAPAKVDIFHDWAAITALGDGARAAFARWISERRDANRRACRGVHTLAASPLMFLALEATQVLVRSYSHHYRDRAAFDLARQKALHSPSHEPFGATDGSGGPPAGPRPSIKP